MASGYIVTADLECCGDDHCQFYINGTLGGQTGWNFDQMINYSTADGTLDLNDFLPGVQNLIACDNPPNTGGPQCITFRLTVRYSDGTTDVVWSNPDATSKFFHVQWPLPVPVGWMNPGFNDSAWTTPFDITYEDSGYYVMPDASNVPYGYVPWLSNSQPFAPDPPGSQNLYRNYFSFPGSGINLAKSASVSSVMTGGQVDYTLAIGTLNDTVSTITVYDTVPAGTVYVPGSVTGGGTYNPVTNMLSWTYNLTGQVTFNYSNQYISSVISAPGWTSPASAVGVTQGAFGTMFTPGNTGWFQVAAPNVANQNQYIIAGVIFHNTVESLGLDGLIDPLYFNYSADGTNNGFLTNPPNIMRETTELNSLDGYYDATADRHWTWQDLNNLRVEYYNSVSGVADASSLDGLDVIVKYYQSSVPPFGYSVVVTATANCPGPTVIDNTAALQGSGLVTTTSNDVPVTLSCYTNTSSPTPSITLTSTPTATITVTATRSFTATTTNTPTVTFTSSQSFTSTATPSQTLTFTQTATFTQTLTSSQTFTPSYTTTPSYTVTPSQTLTSSQTFTNTLTFTPTASAPLWIVYHAPYPCPSKDWGGIKIYVRMTDYPDHITFRIYTTSIRTIWTSKIDIPANSSLLPIEYDNGVALYTYTLPYNLKDMFDQYLANGMYYYTIDATTKSNTNKSRLAHVIGKFAVLR